MSGSGGNKFESVVPNGRKRARQMPCSFCMGILTKCTVVAYIFCVKYIFTSILKCDIIYSSVRERRRLFPTPQRTEVLFMDYILELLILIAILEIIRNIKK